MQLLLIRFTLLFRLHITCTLAGERGYQSLINDTLRKALGRENLEQTLRRVVREELRRGAG